MYAGFDVMQKKYSFVVIGLVYAAMVAQTSFFYSRLPGTLASHFDFSGNPNGSLDKFWFFAFYFLLQVGLTVALWYLSKLCRLVPKKWISIPNKEFWLRSDTRHRFFALNEATMIWIAAFTGLMLLLMAQLIFDANLANIPVNPSAILLTVLLYLCSVFGTVLYFYRSLHIFG